MSAAPCGQATPQHLGTLRARGPELVHGVGTPSGSELGCWDRHGYRPRSRVAEVGTGNQKWQEEAAVCEPQPARSQKLLTS